MSPTFQDPDTSLLNNKIHGHDQKQNDLDTTQEHTSARTTAITLEKVQYESGATRSRAPRNRAYLEMSSTENGHSYELVGDDEDQALNHDGPIRRRRKIPVLWHLELLIRSYPKAFFISILMLAFIIYSLVTWPFWKSRAPLGCDSVNHGFQCQPEISHKWGQYSPYFSVPSDISNEVPERCEITFVQVLSRHGARDPTRSKTILYSSLIKSLHASVSSFKGKYAFLQDYQYTLGADQLTPLGKRHMINSGIKFYHRYKDLALAYKPFVRSSGQQRVIDSANLFIQGYHDSCSNDTLDPTVSCNDWPYPYVEISEEPGSHNPLDHGLCDAFEKAHRAGITKKGQDTYRDVFAEPITARLNADLPGAGLENDETIMIMDLCPFETVAHPDGKLSPFCDLFTEEEWTQYDYYETLGKYYGFGSHYNLGPTQGVGFTNELIARLSSTPVEDRTSVDHELDNDPKTFPLGGEWRIYADFSHDNDMVSILSAMGVFSETSPLSNTTFQDETQTNGFSTSWLTPFAARIYFEKMVCKDSTGDDEEYIRVIVNDRVQKMKSCSGDELGRCKLSAFLASQSFAKSGGRWDEC